MDSLFQSATFNPKGHLSLYSKQYPNHHENLIYFLTLVQYFQVNIIPITWQPALDDLGRGTSAVVNQSMIHAQLNFAFKRTGPDTAYSTLIAEVAILSLPQVRCHTNINRLEGVCWEMRDRGHDMIPAVWPVLIYAKAEFGNLRDFMRAKDGMTLSLRQKLDICLDIARAIDELHNCGVVHGDIKPENCLVFPGAVAGETVAKVSDLGFSSIWARPDDLMPVPRTETWSAPEWHHRAVGFSEARKMDVFSFGLLCVWIAVQSHDLEEPIENIKALLFTPKGDFQVDMLTRLKTDASMIDAVTQTLEGGTKTPSHSILLKVLRGTLQLGADLRDSSLLSAITILDDGFQPGPNETKDDSSFSSVLPAHAHIDLTDNYLLGQIASSEIEVRCHLITELLSLGEEDPQSGCPECKRYSALQLAFHYLTGFGVGRDAVLSEHWLKESNSTSEELQVLIPGMQRWTYDNPLYRPGSFQALVEQGIIDYKDEDSRWSYDPKLKIKIDEMVMLEAYDLESSLGRDSYLTNIAKQMAARNLNARGEYIKAMNFRSEVYDVVKRTSSENSLALASAACQLASVLADLGRLDEAGDLSERAIGIYVTKLGKDHSLTWGGMTNLSFVRTLQGQYQEALKIDLDIVNSVETLFGEDHPIVCHFLNTISGLYYYQGLFRDAEKISRDVLARCIRSLGESHIDTARSKASLARINMEMGYLSEAEAQWDEVIHYYTMTLGAEHPETLLALGEKAVVYRCGKQLEKAEALSTKSLDIALQKLGPNHPSCLILATGLSTVLADQHRFHESLKIEVELYPRMKVVKGQSHPQTLFVMTGLAHTYRECGLLKESEELELQVLRMKEISLGRDHPQTIMTRGSLAKVYERQSRLTEAEILYREVQGARERISGSLDKFTLRAKSDLSALLHMKGDFEEALSLMEQVREGRETIYDRSSHLIFQALHSIASIRHSMGRFEEEESTRIDILNRSTSYIGEDNPQTLSALQQLAALYTTRRDWQKAKKYLGDEVELRRRLNGEDLSGLLTALANLAVTHGYQGQWELAARLMEEVYNGKVETLGEEHPDSIEAKELLDHLHLQARSERDEAVRQLEWQMLMEAKVR